MNVVLPLFSGGRKCDRCREISAATAHAQTQGMFFKKKYKTDRVHIFLYFCQSAQAYDFVYNRFASSPQFVCLNDDIKTRHPDPRLFEVLYEFFEGYYPVVSPFELPQVCLCCQYQMLDIFPSNECCQICLPLCLLCPLLSSLSSLSFLSNLFFFSSGCLYSSPSPFPLFQGQRNEYLYMDDYRAAMKKSALTRAVAAYMRLV